MEGVPAAIEVEVVLQPDLLEAFADREVTLFGISGTFAELALMCPVDLSDPGVSLEAKNDFVVKAANNAGLEIDQTYEPVFDAAVKRLGLEPKFSIATPGRESVVTTEPPKKPPEAPLERHAPAMVPKPVHVVFERSIHAKERLRIPEPLLVPPMSDDSRVSPPKAAAAESLESGETKSRQQALRSAAERAPAIIESASVARARQVLEQQAIIRQETAKAREPVTTAAPVNPPRTVRAVVSEARLAVQVAATETHTARVMQQEDVESMAEPAFESTDEMVVDSPQAEVEEGWEVAVRDQAAQELRLAIDTIRRGAMVEHAVIEMETTDIAVVSSPAPNRSEIADEALPHASAPMAWEAHAAAAEVWTATVEELDREEPLVVCESFSELLRKFAEPGQEPLAHYPEAGEGIDGAQLEEATEAVTGAAIAENLFPDESSLATVLVLIADRLVESEPEVQETAAPVIKKVVGAIRDIHLLKAREAGDDEYQAAETRLAALCAELFGILGIEYDEESVSYAVQRLLGPVGAPLAETTRPDPELEHIGTREVKLRTPQLQYAIAAIQHRLERMLGKFTLWCAPVVLSNI